MTDQMMSQASSAPSSPGSQPVQQLILELAKEQISGAQIEADRMDGLLRRWFSEADSSSCGTLRVDQVTQVVLAVYEELGPAIDAAQVRATTAEAITGFTVMYQLVGVHLHSYKLFITHRYLPDTCNSLAHPCDTGW